MVIITTFKMSHSSALQFKEVQEKYHTLYRIIRYTILQNSEEIQLFPDSPFLRNTSVSEYVGYAEMQSLECHSIQLLFLNNPNFPLGIEETNNYYNFVVHQLNLMGIPVRIQSRAISSLMALSLNSCHGLNHAQ